MTPDVLLPLTKVSEQTSLSPREILRQVKDGRFPQPARLGRSVRWSQAEISLWVKKVLASRERQAS